MANKKLHEIRNDYTDEDRYTHIDVWASDDDNEEGRSVAIVCQDTGKVYFIDNGYRFNEEVLQAIKEVTPKTSPAKPTPESEDELELRTSREGYLFIDQEQGGENYTVAIFSETEESFATELVRRYNDFPEKERMVKVLGEKVGELAGINYQQKEQIKVMLEKLTAIIARIHGEWDNPALVKQGLLSDSDSDILNYANAAIQSATK